MKGFRVGVVLAVMAVLATLAVGTRAEAALPGQNTLIAFERHRSGGSSGSMAIWTMNADGTSQAMLLEIGQTTTDPAWSPDMDPATAGYQGRIAFIADGDVWVARADGGGATNLTNSPVGSVEREPTWSPDLDPGTSGYQGRIAFASVRSACQGCPANEDVYTIASTGGSELRLTEQPTSDREPAWSPDGTRIAFWTNRAITSTYPGGAGLYVMGATGSSETKIKANTPDDVGTNAGFPNWSPDGARIVVNGDANHPGIRVVDAASGTISAQLSDYPIPSSGGQVNFPAFSPQGDKIAFMQRLPGAAASDFDIVVMNSDGSNEVNLTRSAGTRDEDPDWQPAAAPVDAVAPTVPAVDQPAARFQKGTSIRVSWSSTDSGSPVGGFSGGTYYVRVRSANSRNATLTPYAWWRVATAGKTATFVGVKGSTYCFSAMARDRSGNVSAWSSERCTAVPLDDATMVASAGMDAVASAVTGYYQNSYTASSTNGAKLSIGNVQAKRLALLATKGPTAGTIEIAWNGTLLRQVSLTSSTTVKQSLIQIAPFASVQTGTVTITVVSSGKRVEIDGLAVSAV